MYLPAAITDKGKKAIVSKKSPPISRISKKKRQYRVISTEVAKMPLQSGAVLPQLHVDQPVACSAIWK